MNNIILFESKNIRRTWSELEQKWYFSMLGEASTTEIARKKDAQGLVENKKVASEGGTIAGDARNALERKTGGKISTKENYKALPESTQRKVTKNKIEEEEDHRFDKTEILVELAKWGGERYISRSQAKRILTDLDRFSRIVLDFRNVETVGQGFMDEVFRVFQNQHPAIQITYRNANENVLFMIQRGTALGGMARFAPK